MTQSTANRLKDSASPYLRSAAHQPIDWNEWGDEAFAKARAEQKPVLLDMLWALAPFLLVGEIGFGLALASTAALLYSPFAQRSLVLMGTA